MHIVVKGQPLTYAEKTYQVGETLTATDHDGGLLCTLDLAKAAPRRLRSESDYTNRRLKTQD